MLTRLWEVLHVQLLLSEDLSLCYGCVLRSRGAMGTEGGTRGRRRPGCCAGPAVWGAEATAEAQGWDREGGQPVLGTEWAPPVGLESGFFPYLSLSSLLTDESRLSTSLSLSWAAVGALRSSSPGFSQGGGVGNDGGVRCSRFQGSWGLLKFCTLGPSLWPNIELGAEMVKWRTKRFKRNYIICCNEGTYPKTFNSIQLKWIHIIGSWKRKGD